MATTRFNLFPMDVIDTIEGFLPYSDKARLARTCKRFYNFNLFHRNVEGQSPPFYRPNNNRIYTAAKQLQCLLEYMKKDKVDKILEMLKEDPGILLEVNRYGFTALQLAYREGDVQICLLLKTFLEKLFDGENKCLQQLSLSFIESVDKHAVSYDFNDIIIALENNLLLTRGCSLLDKFRNDISRLTAHQRFPTNILLDVYKIFSTRYATWSKEQTELFSIQIIGYLQRLSPLWLKQRFANGMLWCISFDDRPLRSCILNEGGKIQNLVQTPNQGLGFTSCIDIRGQANVTVTGCEWKNDNRVMTSNLIYEIVQRDLNKNDMALKSFIEEIMAVHQYRL